MRFWLSIVENLKSALVSARFGYCVLTTEDGNLFGWSERDAGDFHFMAESVLRWLLILSLMQRLKSDAYARKAWKSTWRCHGRKPLITQLLFESQRLCRNTVRHGRNGQNWKVILNQLKSNRVIRKLSALNVAGWLMPCPRDSGNAFCKVCQTSLKPH